MLAIFICFVSIYLDILRYILYKSIKMGVLFWDFIFVVSETQVQIPYPLWEGA